LGRRPAIPQVVAVDPLTSNLPVHPGAGGRMRNVNGHIGYRSQVSLALLLCVLLISQGGVAQPLNTVEESVDAGEFVEELEADAFVPPNPNVPDPCKQMATIS